MKFNKHILNESYFNNLSLYKIRNLLLIRKNSYLRNARNDFSDLLEKYSVVNKFFKKIAYIPYIPDIRKNNLFLEIEKILKKNNMLIVDYNNAIAISKVNGKNINILKLLKKLKVPYKLIHEYNIDRKITKYKKYYLAIEPHEYKTGVKNPLDIGCVNIYNSRDNTYIQAEIQEGSYKCSLIRKTDLNVKEPICSVLIKPMINIDNNRDIYYHPDKDVYGNPPNDFLNQVNEILSELQLNKKRVAFNFVNKFYCASDLV